MAESESCTESKPSLIGFPTEFPYEFDSPAFTSSSNSTDTKDESSDDEEDFLAGLTRRLALSTQRVSIPSFHNNKSEGRVVARSPQSTLSGLSSWSASRNGSPNGSSSRVASPPTTPFLANKDETWEIIHRAAGEVARLKMNEATQINYPNLQKPQNAPFQFRHVEPQNYSNANQFVSLKEAVNQQCCSDLGSFWQTEPEYRKLGFHVHRRDAFSAQESRKFQKPLFARHSGCPPRQLRQQLWQSRSPAAVTGAASVSAKRQCAGTGVFLPRRYTNTSDDYMRKPVCSPVPVPARSIHSLNLNSEDAPCVLPPRLSTGFGDSHYDPVMARRRALLLQHQRSLRARRQEMPLPQEWMY